ncbi:MAG: hypothetical protein ACTSPY_00790 [Candidatus Helarchaeota archaeon]
MVNNKLDIITEDAKTLDDLENLIGKKIPVVDNIFRYTFGVSNLK